MAPINPNFARAHNDDVVELSELIFTVARAVRKTELHRKARGRLQVLLGGDVFCWSRSFSGR